MTALVVPAWAWALLAVILISCLVVDALAHRGDHVDSRRGALAWSAVWIAVALAFGGVVTWAFGATAGEQYFAAYALEKSLSIDNLFLFLVVFESLRIPAPEQRRVLTWGIVGALVARALFIVIGVAALHRWHEITYVFGALLAVTAFKLLRTRPADPDRGQPAILRWLARNLPWTADLHGHRFVTRIRGRRVGTPLLLALLAIELADIVFALDSLPAAFAVTESTFLLYSSNIFAVLGLRALFVVLAGALAGMRYLRFGLAAVLGFAGLKLLLAGYVTVSPLASVGVIVGCIGTAVAASVWRKGQRPS